ncbi:hypothetical protein H072_10980 [Dactylellina haptotyla CBS 200.50]|uniref:Uncharacterized protein n=1 Tax=Dactylellina haptotyla (strain CBS 200.50) TaxID=1284197 RepID=S8A392_DACHA|nr:hypothetical protein H072_10980 [Dactylellina haptotyla CBS 200.50]
MSASDVSPTSGFRSIKTAFRRGSKASTSSGSSPPGNTSSSSNPAAAAAASLASKNYPHIHIKEMVYEACTKLPKHSYEESVADCKCGKRAVGRYREICALKDTECPGCKFGFDSPQEESDDEYYY